MERRYRLMSLTKTRNLGDFNQKMEETNELSKLIARYRVVDNPIINFEQISALFQPLPRIVVIVSELKELILDGTLLNEKMIINMNSPEQINAGKFHDHLVKIFCRV